MNTIEGNKLIAEFMGWKHRKTSSHPHVFPNGLWDDTESVGHKELFFHSSWDWLMPVVEKITAMGFRVEIDMLGSLGNDVHITNKGESLHSTAHSKTIDAVYVAVVQFIKWFNQGEGSQRSVASKAQSELPDDGNITFEDELNDLLITFMSEARNYSEKTQSSMKAVIDFVMKKTSPDGSQGLREALEKIAYDAYPEDIFPPITSEQWKQIHEMIKEKFGFPIDRLTAEYSRLLLKPRIEIATEALKK